MLSINRAIAVIKPKQPLVDWINQLPDPLDPPETIESLQQDCTTFLIPEYDRDEEAREWIKGFYDLIFENELDSWYTDESYWPEKRDYETFLEWFDVEIHSEIYDSVEGKIKKSEI